MAKYFVVSGGFDPFTDGHADMFYQLSGKIIYDNWKNTDQKTDCVVVILNSDKWLLDKKGYVFMPFEARKLIMSNIKNVSFVVAALDDNDQSVASTLRYLAEMRPGDTFEFVNSGDRIDKPCQEEILFKENRLYYDPRGQVSFSYIKSNRPDSHSSKYILNAVNAVLKQAKNSLDLKVPNGEREAESEWTERDWGRWRVLHESVTRERILAGPAFGHLDPDVSIHKKYKLLIVEPGKSLSMQKHALRQEDWIVLSGSKGVLDLSNDIKQLNEPLTYNRQILKEGQHVKIETNQWHKLYNRSANEQLIIFETQTGLSCSETDIIRNLDYKG